MHCKIISGEAFGAAAGMAASIFAIGSQPLSLGTGATDDRNPPRTVETGGSLGGVIASLKRHKPDLVLLNDDGCLVVQPGRIVSTIKAETDIPCVIRSLRPDGEADRIEALEAGCDDCIDHGVSEREAQARIRAVLRRALHRRPAAGPAPPRAWRISPERRELYSPDGSPCRLTSAEFDLLHALVRQRGAVVSREALSQAVFRRTWYPTDRGIDNLAARLRRKLSRHSPNAAPVKPVRGVGYAFTGF